MTGQLLFWIRGAGTGLLFRLVPFILSVHVEYSLFAVFRSCALGSKERGEAAHDFPH
jgi:hypothetical protein